MKVDQAGLYAVGGVIAAAGIAVWTEGLTRNPPSQNLQSLGYIIFGFGLAIILKAMLNLSSRWRGRREPSVISVSVEPQVQGNTMELLVRNTGSDSARFKVSMIDVNPRPANHLTHWTLPWSGSQDAVQDIGPGGDSWPVHLGEAGLWRRASDGELAGSIALERFGSSNVPFNYENSAECSRRSPVIVTVRIARITPPAHVDRKFEITLEAIAPNGEALPRLADVTEKAAVGAEDRPISGTPARQLITKPTDPFASEQPADALGVVSAEGNLGTAAAASLTPVGANVAVRPTRRHGKRNLAVVAAGVVISASAIYVGLFGIGGQHPTMTGLPQTQLQGSFSPKIPVPPAVLTDPKCAAASVAFSPTGKLLAVGGRSKIISPCAGSVYIWDLDTRRIIAILLDPHGKGVNSVAFGPGGTLAAGDLNGATYMWNLATQKVVATLTDPGGQGVNSVTFSPSDTTLAVGDRNGATYVWKLATQQVSRFTDPDRQAVDSVAFSPDGATMAVGDDNGNIYLWNLADHKIITTLHHPQDTGTAPVILSNDSVAFGHGGTTLAVGYFDCTFIWNLAERKVISSLCDPGSYGVLSVVFGPGGTTLATADANGVTFLWNLATRTAARFYIANAEAADSVAFDPSGDLLAVGQEDGTTYLWAISLTGN